MDNNPPTIEVVSPQKDSFYMFGLGQKIFSLKNRTVIIGFPRELMVYATDETGIEKVEFYMAII